MPSDTSNYGIPLSERISPSAARFERALRKLANSLRVAMPGVIQSFDAIKQTVVVQPAIVENVSYLSTDAGGWETVKKTATLPVLQDVPIVPQRGGGFAATFPIKKGDECLVIFADMCIDAWWQSGGTNNNQIDTRRHDLSDAFAILGPWSQPRRLKNYSTTSAQLRSDDGTVVVDVAGSQITLTAPNVQVNASSTATIQADQVNITGSSGVTISGSGNTKIENREFLTHDHTGGTISGNTGPVV